MKLINMYPDVVYSLVIIVLALYVFRLVQRELPLAGLTADLRDTICIVSETKYKNKNKVIFTKNISYIIRKIVII